MKFLGFEATLKKVEAVKLLKDELELPFVRLFQERLENIFFDKPCVITMKAVGKCKDYLKKINTDQEVFVFFYKGLNFYELEGKELKEVHLRSQGSLKDWELIDEKLLQTNQIDSVSGRYMIGLKKKRVLKNCWQSVA